MRSSPSALYLKLANSKPFEGGILPSSASDALCQHGPGATLLTRLPPSLIWLCSPVPEFYEGMERMTFSSSLLPRRALLPLVSQGHSSTCTL